MTLPYTFTPLAYPGALYTFGYDINNSGQVVGYFLDENNYKHAFFFDGQTYTTIDPSFAIPYYAFVASAYNISNDGHVLGQAYDPATNTVVDFIYDPITHSDTILHDPTGGSLTQVTDISNAGVTGYYWNGSKYLGFTYENDSYVSMTSPAAPTSSPQASTIRARSLGMGSGMI